LASLQSQGEGGVRVLSQLFVKMDKNGNGVLDRHEIQWVLRQLGMKLNVAEFERIFKFFDKNGDGVVSYHEFVTAVRGEMSADRVALVETLAARVTDKDGCVVIADLMQLCNWEADPSVTSGKKTIAEQKEQLRAAFSLQIKDGKISV